MSQENIFKTQRRMREEQRAEQARTAEAAREAGAAERAKAAALAIQQSPTLQRLQAKEQRDASFQGTAPEVVWGEKAGKLCKDFIEFMGEAGMPELVFRGATTLKYAVPSSPWVDHDDHPYYRIKYTEEKQIKGYGIGAVAAGTFPYTDLPHNVFLCEDNRLRTYTSQPIQVGHGQGVTGASWNCSPGAGGNPSILADLPVDKDGYTIIPSVGNLSYQYIPAVYVNRVVEKEVFSTKREDKITYGGPDGDTSTEWGGGDYVVTGVHTELVDEPVFVRESYATVTFDAMKLEDILNWHAGFDVEGMDPKPFSLF